MFQFVVVRKSEQYAHFLTCFTVILRRWCDGRLLCEVKERVQGEQTVEIMVHPAYIDPELVKRSSYVMDRVKELRILTESELPEGIELVKF